MSKNHNIIEAGAGKAVTKGMKGAVAGGLGALAGSKLTEFADNSEKFNNLSDDLSGSKIVTSVKETLQENDFAQKAADVWHSVDDKMPQFVQDTQDGTLIVKTAAVTGIVMAGLGFAKGAIDAHKHNHKHHETEVENKVLKNLVTDMVRDGVMLEVSQEQTK